MYVYNFLSKHDLGVFLLFYLSTGQLYPVDIAGGKPEIFQVAAEAYYAKLLQQGSSSPDLFSIPGGEKVIALHSN